MDFAMEWMRTNRCFKCVAGLLSATMWLGGCAGSQDSGSLTGAVSAYNAQQYSQSLDQANVALKNTSGTQRDEVAYVAGLSAYQLGRTDEAEARFITAANSASSETACKGKAMLGQIRLDQNRPREAASYFTAAQPGLTGDDAQKCAHNAAVAYQMAGDTASSKQWQSTATRAPASTVMGSGPSSSGSANTMISAPANFTLQVGAFMEKKRAKKAAEEANSLAKKDGLGKVQMFTRTDAKGRRMYMVQVGGFATREQAVAARTKMGRLDYIVAPATSS
jgi:septal ring-binding cell division protein DamX